MNSSHSPTAKHLRYFSSFQYRKVHKQKWGRFKFSLFSRNTQQVNNTTNQMQMSNWETALPAPTPLYPRPVSSGTVPLLKSEFLNHDDDKMPLFLSHLECREYVANLYYVSLDKIQTVSVPLHIIKQIEKLVYSFKMQVNGLIFRLKHETIPSIRFLFCQN